jgi:hypothetical protein
MFAIKSVLCVARWLRLVVDYTIAEFCDAHCACSSGRRWALANCQSMQDVWNNAKPEYLIWVATRRGVLTDRELRLFAVVSARRVQHLMTDPRSVAALDVAERHANGLATDAELAAARDAAVDAAVDAAMDAAVAAARAAAWDAAWDAARAAAWAAARDAAGDAARAAAWAAAREAARDAAVDAQAAWLRENTRPDFTRK